MTTKPEIISGSTFIQNFCKAYDLDKDRIQGVEIIAMYDDVVKIKLHVIGDDRLFNITQGNIIKEIMDKAVKDGRVGLIEII